VSGDRETGRASIPEGENPYRIRTAAFVFRRAKHDSVNASNTSRQGSPRHGGE
jgi:hypothetical protein